MLLIHYKHGFSKLSSRMAEGKNYHMPAFNLMVWSVCHMQMHINPSWKLDSTGERENEAKRKGNAERKL